MQDVAVDNYVISRHIGEVTVHRFEHPRALGDVHDFVGLRVPIEVRVDLIGLHVEHADVAVEQQRNAIERRAASLPGARGEEVTMPERRVVVGFPLDLTNASSGLDRRRRIRVIEQRRGSDEPFVPHQLFGVQAAVRTTEDRMTLLRNFA